MIYTEPCVPSHQKGSACGSAGHPHIAMRRNECYATKKTAALRNEDDDNYAQPIVETSLNARNPDITVQKNQCYAAGIKSKERNSTTIS